MPAASTVINAFFRAATKWGPWTALALGLVALLALRFDSELQAQGDQIARLLNQQERQVDLLRIICTAVVHTDTERRACEFAGGSR